MSRVGQVPRAPPLRDFNDATPQASEVVLLFVEVATGAHDEF